MKPTVFASPIAVLAALLYVAAAGASQTQGSNPPKWWQSDLYKRELNLTADQSKHLEEIFQAAVPKQKELKKALDEAEAQFEHLAEQRDQKNAEGQIHRVISARAELMKSHSLMLLEMRFVLSPQQWSKLGALQQQQQKANEKQRASEKVK
jgi:periplasmic protein CpxP/Spy